MPRSHAFSSFRAFSIDPGSDEPLHRQLYNELRAAILGGRLPSGCRLPASRELAHVTGLSRNTVLSAYDQLVAEGYINSRAGSGTYVASTLPDQVLADPQMEPLPVAEHSARQLTREGKRLRAMPFRKWPPASSGPMLLRAGMPALDQFPMDTWRRLTDKRQRQASVRTLAYDDPQGYLPLREAIAEHLAAARGARCSPEQILVCSGSQQAIALAQRVLVEEGDEVLFEDPGYFAARAVFEAAGARLVPVPVDEDGFDVAAAVHAAPNARLAYVTPSHQNPLCVTMSLPRRRALLHWAETHGGWILEDDNASECRYRGRPLAALQGIDPHGRVLYAGTFSKVMFSSLRLGYLVAPPDLVATLVRARELMDRQSPGIPQAVMADFMTEGHFARHLRRMRTVYATRLAVLMKAVRDHAADLLEITELEGGLNRVAWLPPGLSDSDAVAALRPEGFACLPLSEFRLRPGARGGLVLGFAGMIENTIENAIRRLAGILRAMPRDRRPAGAEVLTRD
jgi:GntR family transcriptional regulator/MocR family aminotransferase